MKRSLGPFGTHILIVLITSILGATATLRAAMFESVASGNWSQTSTWNSKTLPGPGDTVIVTAHDVILDCSATISLLLIGSQGPSSVEFDAIGISRILQIETRLDIAPGSRFDSPLIGIPTMHTLRLLGDLVNHGFLHLDRNNTMPCILTLEGSAAQTLEGTGPWTILSSVRLEKSGPSNPVLCRLSITSSNVPWHFIRGTWIQADGTLLLTSDQRVGPDCHIEVQAGGLLDLRQGTLHLQGELRLTPSGVVDIGIEGAGSLVMEGPGTGARLDCDGGLVRVHSGALHAHAGVVDITAGMVTLSPRTAFGGISLGVPVLLVDSSAQWLMSGGLLRVVDPNGNHGPLADLCIGGNGSHSITGGCICLGDETSGDLTGAPFSIASTVMFPQVSVMTLGRNVELFTTLIIAERLDLVSGTIGNCSNPLALMANAQVHQQDGTLSCPPLFDTSVRLWYEANGPVVTGPEWPSLPVEVTELLVDTPSGLILDQDARITQALTLRSGGFDCDGAAGTVQCRLSHGCRIRREQGSLVGIPYHEGDSQVEYSGTIAAGTGEEVPPSGRVGSFEAYGGAEISLSRDIDVADSAVFATALVDLSSFVFRLADGACWKEDDFSRFVSNGGWIEAERDLTLGFENNVAGLGLDVEQPSGVLGPSQIRRTHDAVIVGGQPGIGRVFELTSGSSVMVGPVLHYLPSEVQGLSPGHLTGYVSLDGGATWTSDPGATVDSVTNTIHFSPLHPPFRITGGRIQPQPVELIAFSGRRLDEKHVRLTWRTATETNCEGFFVERREGEAWVERRFLEGQGTTSHPHEYRIDDVVDHPFTSTYRLRQVDRDGTIHWSPELVVEGWGGHRTPFTVYPTRTTGFLTLVLPTPESRLAGIRVIDLLGRPVHDEWVDPVMSSASHTLCLPDLPRGSYILHCLWRNREHVEVDWARIILE